MDHAITIGDIVAFLAVIGVIFGFLALCVFFLWLFNPFRSGH